MTTATAVNPAIAAHEARHAAAALLLGLKVTQARADNPNPEMGGYVELGGYSCLRPRDSGIMTLAGRWGDPGWPLENPSKQGRTFDERNLADDVETLGRGHAGYQDMVADTERLVERPEFKSLAGMLEPLLAAGIVLNEDRIRWWCMSVRQVKTRTQDPQGNRENDHRPGEAHRPRRGMDRRPRRRPDHPRRVRQVDTGGRNATDRFRSIGRIAATRRT